VGRAKQAWHPGADHSQELSSKCHAHISSDARVTAAW
jgi:hypothetical protein